MRKALRARAGQVDGRQSQKVFDLEGEVRSWAKQSLAHMQLLLAHAISTPSPPLSITHGHMKQSQRKGQIL